MSFSARGTALVLALLFAFSLAIWFSANAVTSRHIKSTAVSALSALATAKQHALEAQIERNRDMVQSMVLTGLAGTVAQILESTGPEKARLEADLRNDLQRQLQASDLLVSAVILDPDEKVIASTEPEARFGFTSDPRFLDDARLRSTISRPYLDGPRYYLDLATPLTTLDGDLLAVLVVKKGADHLLAITGDHVGLGDTGETVLGRRRSDHVEFIIPLRFAPDPAAAPFASVSGDRAAPMIAATAGQSGMHLGLLDYRDVPVAAVYRPVSGTDWGMVVKQDMHEVLQPMTETRRTLALVLFGILGVGALAVYPGLRLLTLPLKNLMFVTERVAQGDLNAWVPETNDPDTNALARSFNRMILQLRESRATLERRNAELREFAHVVSHDLKAPLRGIAGVASWLQEDLGEKVEGESEKHLQWLRERVVEMDALIESLLEYSRVGRVTHKEADVDTGALVQRVVDSLSPPDGFEVRQASGLPAVRADPIRLTQVFQNLIGNAIQHHPGPEGTVEVSAKDVGEFWEFTIQDDGMGIESRYHDQVFKIFSRLSRGGQSGSTGLGLAIVTKILADVGGRIWLESEGVPGEGSIFRFTWPKEPKEDHEA